MIVIFFSFGVENFVSYFTNSIIILLETYDFSFRPALLNLLAPTAYDLMVFAATGLKTFHVLPEKPPFKHFNTFLSIKLLE